MKGRIMSSLRKLILASVIAFFSLPAFAQEVFAQEEQSARRVPGMGEYSFHLSGGYAFTYLKLEVDDKDPGYVGGRDVESISYALDTIPQVPLAMSMGIEYGLPEGFELLSYFSFGLSVDYRCIDLEDVKIKGETAGTTFYGLDREMATMSIISVTTFLEWRYPIENGKTWLVPYLQLGIGVNINLSDNSDVFSTRVGSFAMFAAAGLEHFLDENFSMFAEGRWHYDKPEFRLTVADTNTRLKGEVELSSVAMMIGFNYYFGRSERESGSTEEVYSYEM